MRHSDGRAWIRQRPEGAVSRHGPDRRRTGHVHRAGRHTSAGPLSSKVCVLAVVESPFPAARTSGRWRRPVAGILGDRHERSFG